MKNNLKVLPLILTTLAGFIVILFQACSVTTLFDRESTTKSQASGNGDSYGGKLESYHYHSENQPCTEVGKNGEALSNEQILFHTDGTATLVRENCEDIAPVTLNKDEFNYLSEKQAFIFRTHTFELHGPVNDFDIVAANCPSTHNPVAVANRQNLLQSSQNLTSPNWMIGPGISSTVHGTIASIPRFLIRRSNPNHLEPWQRISQVVSLTANVQYSLSMLIESGNSSELRLIIHQNQGSLQTVIDISNGNMNLEESTGFTGITSESLPVGHGRFFTLRFTPTVDMSSADIGFTPNLTNLNQSIFITAVQLENLSTFCTLR